VPRVARRAVVDGTVALARQAPEFAPYIDAHGPADLRRARPRRTHFAELARAICFQQLAGAAARTIHGRFEAALGGDVTPEGVLALPVETMRAAGLSGNKTASIRDLAEKCWPATSSSTGWPSSPTTRSWASSRRCAASAAGRPRCS